MPDAVDVDPASVQTNIVMVSVGPNLTDEGMTAPVVCDRLREKGVLAMALMPGVIRFVTHSQVYTSRDVYLLCDLITFRAREKRFRYLSAFHNGRVFSLGAD